MIQVQHVTHRYPKMDRPAVADASFEIPKGEIFGFLGPNGAGKSTVQNLLIGLLTLQSGEILYDGVSVRNIGRKFFNRVGVSFEQQNLYAKLTGYENLMHYANLFSVPTADPTRLLAQVGLAEAGGKRAGTYSKGMRQRLVFARALVNQPDILFLDEPMSGLDPNSSGNIKEMILEQRRKGATIFLTTHNMFMAEELCDHVGFINEGKIAALDTPKNLKLRHGEKSVKVEYREGEAEKSAILFFSNPEDRNRLEQLVSEERIITMHSQEASLEMIFQKLTGRGLE